jgi:hypothetical protein
MPSFALIVTTAKFRMPATPKRCNMRRYHVWRWEAGSQPPVGQRCQCSAIPWSHRESLDLPRQRG